MTQISVDLVTWLKKWFYTEAEVDTVTNSLQTQINNKADSSTVSSLATTVNGKANTNHNQASSTITNATAFNNIKAGESTTVTLTDQAKINSAINDAIGALKSVEIIKVVSDKGTASADTMNKLYIEVGANTTDMYYTKQSGNTYTWAKLDNDILDDLSISWGDVQNKPSFGTGANDFATGNHEHGYISNTGKITQTTSSVSKVLVAESDGTIKTIAKLPSGNVTHQSITGKADKTEALGTTITLGGGPGEANEGCIIFNTIS